jgi:hypothetical protein
LTEYGFPISPKRAKFSALFGIRGIDSLFSRCMSLMYCKLKVFGAAGKRTRPIGFMSILWMIFLILQFSATIINEEY